MRKLKTTFKFICHNRAKKKASLWASLLFQMSQSSKRSLPLAPIWLRITYLFYRLLWKLVLLKTAEILVLRTVFLCSVGFCFSLFFSYLFLFRVLLIFFFFFVVIGNWEAFTCFQRPTANIIKNATMRLTKGHHGKLNRQNRNKMGEDRQRKLIANHQQFNKWIKQIIGFVTSLFFSYLFLFRVLLFCFVFSSYWQLRSV